VAPPTKRFKSLIFRLEPGTECKTRSIDCLQIEAQPANRPARSVSAKKRWLRRICVLLLVGCGLVLAGFLLRAPLLTALAKSWVVNDPVTKADAIVVLGGKPELRPFEAARLYQMGVAPRILYMDVKLSPQAEKGIVISERELTHRILLSNNVPETALVAVGNAVASTFDESRAVLAWMEKTGATSVIVPTDLSHTRRVRWIFRKELSSAKKHAYVEAITPSQYNVTNWWKNEGGLIAFQEEFIKLIYYKLEY